VVAGTPDRAVGRLAPHPAIATTPISISPATHSHLTWEVTALGGSSL
jgi:hypothetical protein